MSITAGQATAMRAGRQRAREERRQEAIRRVEAYRAWCRSGGSFRDMPPVPKDWEFRISRSAHR